MTPGDSLHKLRQPASHAAQLIAEAGAAVDGDHDVERLNRDRICKDKKHKW